ncbi:hypothetical protein EDD21DRAFT_183509 [Dissophora ornata]|nr:hypothetical protein EDD21DRAFT_183509 [Dissophora ornata]
MKAWGLGNFFSSLAVPVGLQKRLLSFLLQRAIGHFLEDDLDLEKLDIELSNGIVHLTDLKLNTRALSDLAAGTPLAVTQGRIGSITATIPWRNIWNGQCVLEIDGIDVTLAPAEAQPASQNEDQALSSSVDLANDFLQQQQSSGMTETALQESLLQTFQNHSTQAPSGFPGDFNSRPIFNPSSDQSSSGSTEASNDGLGSQGSDGEGIQFVAKLIEKLMARIQIICKGTTIRLRHSSSLPLVRSQSTAAPRETLEYELEIRLPYIAYRDETPGWDQPAGAMDASSIRSSSSSSSQGTESASASTLLEESTIPSVIWQDSPESIKTVAFKGFSVWIKQQGGTEKLVAQSDPTPRHAQGPVTSAAADDQDESDSDTDVFSDAQENLSQSMIASQIIPRRSVPPLTSTRPSPAHNQQIPVELYEAEILSTLQHKNRVKVNIRRNTTLVAGSIASQAQTTTKSLLDIDFHIRSIFIALSPNQIAFLLEILALLDSAPLNDNPEINVGRVAGDIDRTSSTPSQTPLSPQRPLSVDPLRTTQSKSPGGRPLDYDRHVDARNLRATTPTPAVFLDSSRFLGGSVYNDNRSAASGHATRTSSSIPPSLTVKLKARVSTFQIFVLYQDPESRRNIPTEANFFKNPVPEALKVGHLKLELDSMILRYQQWTAINTNVGGQKAAKSTKGQIDFTLSNFTIAEWIDSAPKPFDTTCWNLVSDQYRVPPRGQYIPLVEFDSDQNSLLQTSLTSKFPILQMPDRYMSERSLLLRSKKSKRQPNIDRPKVASIAESSSGDKDAAIGITKEVVRIRVHLGAKKDSSRPNIPSLDSAAATSSSGYARDVTIEVKPMQIHLDFFTFQRLEKCLLAILGPNQKAPSSPRDQSEEANTTSQRSMEQQIMEDLEGPPTIAKVKSRMRLRLNSVQLWISVPDMALVLAGQKDTGPEYRSIYDVVALNISKLVLTQSSDVIKGSSHIHDGVGLDSGREAEEHAPKIKVDFANVSAFVIPAHESTSRAILVIGSLANQTAPIPGMNSSVPNLEITMHSPASLPVRYERPSSSGFPRTPALQAFAIFEGEENVHNAVDEEEELLHFKQRTIETSLLVVNTHFPLVAVHLEKKILDTLQLRVNDLGTWATIFSEQLAAKSLASPTPSAQTPITQSGVSQLRSEFTDTRDDRRSSLDGGFKDGCRGSFDGGFRDDQSEHGTDQSTAYGEELRHQAEGSPSTPRVRIPREYQYQPKLVKPTMASILISAQTVEVILDYPTTATVLDPHPGVKSYQINVGEARVFAAAKYQGSTDTYLSVDAEDLEFWEITAQKPKALLLTRMIPKNVKLKSPRPMFHMTSLLSFDPVIMFKENDTNLAFAGVSWKFSIDQTAVDDVQDFFAEPLGIVYYNPPHQRTRIRVSLSECCMDYKPLNIPSRFVLSFEKMKVFSTLIPESPTLKSKVQIYNMSLFLIDHTQSVLTPHYPGVGSSGPGIESRQFWRSLGFSLIGQCPFFELNSVKSKNGQLPLYDLMITNQVFYLETCSDSFETLTQLAAYLGDNGDMPIEKKRILERLAEAERAANRAKSNVVYQDVLIASLDEDAFRKPSLDRESEGAGTLDFVEGFYSVEREDSESDHFTAQMHDSPDVDGFHEVYADLLSSSQSTGKYKTGDIGGSSGGKQPQMGKEKSYKSQSKGKSPVSATKAELEVDSQMQALGISTHAKSSGRLSLEGARRDDHVKPGSSHTRKESQPEDTIRVLDPEAIFVVVENHFSIPVLTEEERAKDER